jgi:hypothetical protein
VTEHPAMLLMAMFASPRRMSGFFGVTETEPPGSGLFEK